MIAGNKNLHLKLNLRTPSYISSIYLLKWQQKKFLSVHHFLKVFKGKLMRAFVKLLAGVGVRKVPDAETVCWVKLPHEELAARLPHRAHLEDGGGWQKNLQQ